MDWWVKEQRALENFDFRIFGFFLFLFYYKTFIKLQEYSEDSNSEPDVDLENQYYNSKALKEDKPKDALQSFQKVLDLEQGNNEKGEWGFKALKQMIKINFKLVSWPTC